MDFILEGAGIFIYPLGLCSFIAVFIVIERLLALRTNKVLPRLLEESLIAGKIPETKDEILGSSLGRIIYFYKNSRSDADSIKAFVQLEMTRLERGMFLLDTVISAAPLLGLLGTVAGLVSVFSAGEVPSQESIAHGVGLALSTTMLGLAIAIPAILASSFLYRKIDTQSAILNICAERLISIKK